MFKRIIVSEEKTLICFEHILSSKRARLHCWHRHVHWSEEDCTLIGYFIGKQRQVTCSFLSPDQNTCRMSVWIISGLISKQFFKPVFLSPLNMTMATVQIGFFVISNDWDTNYWYSGKQIILVKSRTILECEIRIPVAD